MLVRAATLSESMSHYLIARISGNPSIELLCNTELADLEGESALEKVSWVNKLNGEVRSVNAHNLFIMAGASPNTSWLRGRVALDEKGFILTGRDLPLFRESFDSRVPLCAALTVFFEQFIGHPANLESIISASGIASRLYLGMCCNFQGCWLVT
jgi:hypothetical protein